MKGKRKAWISNYAQLEGVSSPAPGRGARPPGPLPGSGEGVPGSGEGVPCVCDVCVPSLPVCV
jgi:hypothetical protein